MSNYIEFSFGFSRKLLDVGNGLQLKEEALDAILLEHYRKIEMAIMERVEQTRKALGVKNGGTAPRLPR